VGGGDFVAHREGRQERADFGSAHLRRVPLAVEEDEPLDPMDVHLLGATAVVAGPDRVAYTIQQLGLGWFGRGRFADGQ
jgi:hypothetical protein